MVDKELSKDYKALGIKVTRQTRKSSLSRVVIDAFTFEVKDKEWYVKVWRKDRIMDRSGTETLAIALKALAKAHDCEFSNLPKRVDKTTTAWLLPRELGDGQGELIT